MDLAAALITFLAVRFSARPPDHSHLYGHGKIESLSALFETLLLLVTCGWIANEAIHRLIAHQIQVEVTVWSFLVMLTSILVDISRSRILSRAAEKYRSQALEADALHFRTDIWSSVVVITGLICVKAAEWFPGFRFLSEADALAALGVCVVVVWISLRLGRRTVDALIDAAPAGLEESITAMVQAIPGVCDCHQLRLRYSGPVLFIDLHVVVDGQQTLAQAHALADVIEEAIHEMVPHSDVTVHPEPA